MFYAYFLLINNILYKPNGIKYQYFTFYTVNTASWTDFFFFLMYYLLTIQQMYFRRRNNTVAKISRVLANVPTMCYGNCLLLWNCCPFVFFFGSGGREGEADEQCQRSHEGQQSPRRTVGGWGAGSPDPAQGLPLSKRRGRVLVRTKTKQKNRMQRMLYQWQWCCESVVWKNREVFHTQGWRKFWEVFKFWCLPLKYHLQVGFFMFFLCSSKYLIFIKKHSRFILGSFMQSFQEFVINEITCTSEQHEKWT